MNNLAAGSKYQNFLTQLLIVGFFTIFFNPNTVATSTPLATITVNARQPISAHTPLSFSLARLPTGYLTKSLRLMRIVGERRELIASQIENNGHHRLCWLLPEEMQAGETQKYDLSAGHVVQPPQLLISMDAHTLKISQGIKPVLRYQYGALPPPANKDSLYTRSGFIHPVWSPNGAVLTRIHPSDHIHHLGFWHPWTKTSFENRKVDFWNLGDGQGTVRFVKFNSLTTGSVFAEFEPFHQYIDLTAPAGEKAALNERWTIRVWVAGEPAPSFWIWDLKITQSCASASPITILKYRYGGFGFRATADWNEKNSAFLTSAGKTRADGNGTRARWCIVSGQTDRGSAGMLLLSHQENHEHPEPMRIWPTQNRDVYFGFCPVVYADWILEPGQLYVRRYRMIVFDDSLSAETAEQFWRAFANPVQVNAVWSE